MFFYAANSNLYRHTERAFRLVLDNRIGSDFLASFAVLGYYLDDPPEAGESARPLDPRNAQAPDHVRHDGSLVRTAAPGRGPRLGAQALLRRSAGQ